MRCPHCGDRETRVVDSRDLDDSATIRRRRECSACATRFTTYERVEAARLILLKRDGGRQEFDREKLAAGLRKALTRRPVPDDAADKAADEIEAELRSQGTTEVDSSRVGALAMAKLRELDQIAEDVSASLDALGRYTDEARGLHPPSDSIRIRSEIVAELERATRALEMIEHGRSIQASARAGSREIEAQTAIKRGYLNVLHAREAIVHQAKVVSAMTEVDAAKRFQRKSV